jgi:ABC-type transport system involved in multi-copper enzyme maturation permease subunit
MNELWDKEIELIAPAWIVAALLAVGAPQLGNLELFQPLGPVALAVGAILLAAAPFGREFSQGTFALLLSQPLPRLWLWGRKVLVLATAFLMLAAVYWLSWRFALAANPPAWAVKSESHATFWILVLAFSGGLWTTLLLRQIAPAIIVMLLAPAGLLTLQALLGEKLWPSHEQAAVTWLLSGYALAGVVASAWMFVHAQDCQWTGGEISLSSASQWIRKARPGVEEDRRRHRPGWALLGKELHLQQLNVLGAAGALLFYFAVAGLSHLLKREHGDTVRQVAGGFVFIVCVVLPLLVGAVAIAEERKFGTLEAHQCLPMSRRRQFLVKLATTYVTLAVGSLVLSGAFLTVANWLDGQSTRDRWAVFLGYCVGWPAAAATLAFYASSLSRSLIQALGLALGFLLCGALGAIFLAAHEVVLGVRLWRGELIWILGLPVALSALWGLSYRNYLSQADDWRTWRHNALVLLTAALGAAAATTAIYHRAWEFVLPLEPAHGAPRFSGPNLPKLVTGGNGAVVVLPDGRLWAQPIEAWEVTSLGNSNLRIEAGRGGFLTGSNWVEVAIVGSLRRIIGRQADGSLWEMALPSRVGPGTDMPQRLGDAGLRWKSIAAGGHFAFAVAEDGTLWQWTSNMRVPRPERAVNLVPFGTATNWVSVRSGASMCIASKSSGSVWRWGGELTFTYGDWRPVWEEVAGFPKSPPVCVDERGNTTVVVLSDGTLWQEGGRPQLALPTREPGKRDSWNDLFRLGTGSDWRAAVVRRDTLHIVALSKDGSLRRSKVEDNPLAADWHVPTSRFNRHSDWVALTTLAERPCALAADGSLWIWPASDDPGDRLIAPPRVPMRLGMVGQ